MLSYFDGKKGIIMAYTRKTAAKTEAVTQSTEVKEEIKQEPKKKTFTDSDYILCRSVWYGGLNIICQSGNRYEFKDYGSECEINYRDLVSLIRKGSEHVFIPRFIIVDDDLLEQFPTVKKVYASMYTSADLIEVLDLPISRMKAEIERLPEETKDVLAKMISSQIANGRLDSISKVRALSEMFDSDFNLLSALFVR